jgi:Domain of unknown function (DUF4326)
MQRNTATTRREMAATVINLTHKPRPVFDVYIGRAHLCGTEFFEPSPWTNPFSWRKLGRQEALRRYEERLLNTPELLARLPELEGKVLGCWCAPRPCRGHVLLRLIEERRGE